MSVSLVLLPGLDGTGDLFAPLLDELSDTMRAVVVRYPTREVLGYRELEQRAAGALPSNASFVILGESFSGPIAVRLAARRPAGLKGTILCASFVASPHAWAKPFAGLIGYLPIRSAARLIGPHALMGRWANSERTEQMLKALDSVSENVLRARLHAAVNVDVTSSLASVEQPMLFLRPNEDRIVPESAARVFADAARHGKVEVVAGPHCLLQCAPAVAARAIEDFVHELE